MPPLKTIAYRLLMARKAMPQGNRAPPLASLQSWLRSYSCSWLLINGKTMELKEKARYIIEHEGPSAAHYYLAQTLFLHGNHDEARVTIKNYIARITQSSSALHLLSDIENMTGNKEAAWEALEAIKNPPLGTCPKMAHLVSNEEDYQRLLRNWKKRYETAEVPREACKIASYLAIGALRKHDYETAKNFYRNTIRKIIKEPKFHAKRRPWIYSAPEAEKALIALKNTLSQANIDFFLISGTLLGCVREGRLLNHDKDIDIGIWDSVPRQKLVNAISTSGVFYFLPSRTPTTIRLRHVNGSTIDIFIHTHENGYIWHGGLKLKWRNSPFRLVPRPFLGTEHLIPENYDTYLTENYGSDWRTPRLDFDSALDTPNGEICNRNEFIVYLLKTISDLIASGRDAKTPRYRQVLHDLGEPVQVLLS